MGPGGLRGLHLLRGRSRVHPPAAQKTNLGWRGHTPVVTVSGRRSGRLSVAGLIAIRPGSRTRLCHRLRVHRAGSSARRNMGERDFIALADGVHQLVKAPIVLVWASEHPRLPRHARADRRA